MDPGVVYVVGAFACWVPAVAWMAVYANNRWPLTGPHHAFAAVEGVVLALLWPLVLGLGLPAYLVARLVSHFLDKETQ